MTLQSGNASIQGEVSQANFKYDAFVSYHSGTDYSLARKLESFLESFHKSTGAASTPVRHLQICRDGSDFTLPRTKEREVINDEQADGLTEHERNVWRIIRAELAVSRYLIVLCSPGAVNSRYVNREIRWFIEHRGAEFVLPVVTNALNPKDNPQECFPQSIIAEGLNQSRIWYDLRGHRAAGKDPHVRDHEDEQVRLAGDLLEWDAAKNGPLSTIWQREQSRKRRRQAVYVLIAAALFLSLGAFALVNAAQRQRAVADRDSALNQRDQEIVKAAQALKVRDDAVAQREKALESEKRAMAERGEALAKEKIAADKAIKAAEQERKARLVADERRREAERQGQIALTRQLSAQSQLLLDQPGTFQELGTLLAVESAKRQKELGVNGVETDQTLRYALSQRLQPVYEVRHPDGVRHAAVSPDGQYLVSYSAGNTTDDKNRSEGLVIVTELKTGREVNRKTLKHISADIGRLSFPPGSKYIAVDFLGDEVWLWDWKTEAEPLYLSPGFMFSFFAQASYSYDGQYAAWQEKITEPTGPAPPGAPPVNDSDERMIKIFNTRDGKQVTGLRNAEQISNAIFSPSAPLVATVGKAEVKLWAFDKSGFTDVGSLKSDRLDKQGGAAKDSPTCLFSGKGSLFLCSTPDGEVVIWRVADRQQVANFRSDSPLSNFTFDAGETRLAATGADGVLRIRGIDNGQEVLRRYVGGEVHQLAFTADGECLALVQDGERVKLWHSASGTYEVVEHDQRVTDSMLAPDLRSLVTSSTDGTARVWQVRPPLLAEQVIRKDEFQLGEMGNFLAFNDNPKDGGAGTSHLWDVAGRKGVARINLGSKAAAAAFSDDGRYFAAAEEDGGRVVLKDSARDVELMRATHPTYHLETISRSESGFQVGWKLNWSPTDSSGQTVLGADEFSKAVPVTYFDHTAKGLYGGTIRPDTVTRTVSLSGEPPSKAIVISSEGSGGPLDPPKMAFSHDGKILATSVLDQIWLWDTSTGRWLAHMEQGYEVLTGDHDDRLTLDLASVGFLGFSPNDRYLISTSTHGGIRLWELADQPQRHPRILPLPAPTFLSVVFSPPTFSPDSEYVTYAGVDLQLHVLRLRDLSAAAVLPAGAGFNLSPRFSPNGRYLASSTVKVGFKDIFNRGSSIVRIWDARSWKLLRTIDYYGDIGSVSFDPGENYLATGDSDRAVRIWDIASGHEVSRVRYPDAVQSVQFGDKGHSLLVHTDSGLTISPWQVGDLITEACHRLTRNLSESEWRDYIGNRNGPPTCVKLAW